MVAPLFVARRGQDGTAANSNPESIELSVNATAGNMLVCAYAQTRRESSLVAQPVYSMPGWTVASQGFRSEPVGGEWITVSVVLLTRVATGTEVADGPWSLSYTNMTGGGGGRAAVYEFEANQGVQVTANGNNTTNPSSTVSLAGTSTVRTAVSVFAYGGASGEGSAVTFNTSGGFTEATFFTSTIGLKGAVAYKETIGGVVNMPTYNNTGVTATRPWAQAGILLGPAFDTLGWFRGHPWG